MLLVQRQSNAYSPLFDAGIRLARTVLAMAKKPMQSSRYRMKINGKIIYYSAKIKTVSVLSDTV
ncbi:hypothetical protein A0G03_06390 [Pectobacterium peruviense]|uniref:Transposase n=1 Tax=Pectobacterium peruviense TaxID=2066479 RepID=A0ABX4S939_9GAMM|nr:hypothetical protein G033_02665 [Pectobacterium peruviense]PKX87075.1 hypothetical protein A0G03_06390 [Pectobacterium peruviense]